MSMSDIKEEAFEALIEKALVGSTKEEREKLGITREDVDSQHPDSNQYYWGVPSDFKFKTGEDWAIDTRRLMSFLHATQQEILDSYKGRNTLEFAIAERITKTIETFGVIKVLREGIDVDNIKLKLWYPKPSAADAEISKEDYMQNQFSITRQQTYSTLHPGDEIDMVLYVNGLPLFTFEWKNPWTGQTARYNGQKQYKEDRNPKDRLLRFGRCLAHFTGDKNEIFFTTKLEGKDTYFMPFNKGLPNGQGAGNPVTPHGYKTSYLWEWVLQKDSVADIIDNYVYFDYGEAKTGKKVPHVLKNAKKLIFPRFHQLDVVNKLLADVAEKGVGERYLIQHSAGSGKTNSITWLAYQIINVCPKTMSAKRAKGLEDKLFNSAIVVTDRRLLDKQNARNINAFGNSDKIVSHADSSSDLKDAIEQNRRIIITTIQKFPEICNIIKDVSDRNFAIIIDEAHSSQSGITSDKMNASMQKESDVDCADTDALIEKLIRDRKMSSNCSYFAFTGTPKRETLERFGWEDVKGERGKVGKFYPFHLYSMKQAIEEGFILDVLTNYTTYQGYYEVIKNVKDNPLFNNDKAQKKIRQAVERNPKTIQAKAEIMMAHFDVKVYHSHKLDNKAKAMVVCKDIECAIHYYQSICDIIAKKKLPYKTLIAFSGEKELGGKKYTETTMNGFSDNKTADKFDEEDDNRILVVANKYLTGFDQSKLCAMYIDKPLVDVLAVQSLSRLNRSAPELGKRSEDLFILDFYNTTEDMKKSFEPYYTATALSGYTDVNVLYELKSFLLSIGVFTMEEVVQFSDLFIKGVPADEWSPIIDTCAQRFNEEIKFEGNGKADFKMKCKQFVKIYSRTSAILEYEVVEWERLFWFFRVLIPELKVKESEDDDLKDLLNSIDLNTYGTRRTALNQRIELDSGESTIDPLSPKMVNAGGEDGRLDPLDKIVKEFNERWFKGWKADPQEQKSKLIHLMRHVESDEDYVSLVKDNSDKGAADDVMNQILARYVRAMRKGDKSFYDEYKSNDSFQYGLLQAIKGFIANRDYANV